MAQDEIGHAQAYYRMLHELGEADPDSLAFGRGVRQFRCASLVSLPKGDWGFSVLRQFLYDAAETVRLSAIVEGSLTPLAQMAAKIRGEEKYHLMHGAGGCFTRRCDQESQTYAGSLDTLYPHALGFEPTEFDETLAQAGICPREEDLQKEWGSAVAPVLKAAKLNVPENVVPVHGGRVGRHPAALRELVEQMQSVFQLDPTVKWLPNEPKRRKPGPRLNRRSQIANRQSARTGRLAGN
jgi:ring-1,2-phenylacetyl-CoA epoxidase subunit PaaC